MDRFIVGKLDELEHELDNLKSNMDRFIVSLQASMYPPFKYLKSNMDRFIASGFYICFIQI